MILKAVDFNAHHLGTVSVRYAPQDLVTEALQVTAENIGSLSVELQTDLWYEDDHPYIKIKAERVDDSSDPDHVTLRIRVNDWIVVLWDEIHVFKDFDFKTTFAFTSLVTPMFPEEIREPSWTPGDGPAEIRDHIRGSLVEGPSAPSDHSR